MITLVSLNVYENKLADKTNPFIQGLQTDVLCLQEVVRSDFERWRDQLGMHGAFAPMVDIFKNSHQQFGVAILSKSPITLTDSIYYGATPADSTWWREYHKPGDAVPHTVLLVAQAEYGGKTFTFGCTHFSWSDGGKSTVEHTHNMERLLKATQRYSDLILAGDFNAPRGRETFAMLNQHFKDNIPASITTTIDGKLHRAGDLPYVVDNIFTSKEYTLHNVHLVDNVSDHCAVVANVERAA